MKKQLSLILLVFIGAAIGLRAQDAKAEAILDALSNKMRQYETITSNFTFSLDDNVNDVHHTQEGILKMKGDKYYIKLSDNQIYSDGETRWTYSTDMNEVYIDNANVGENALNPAKIYTIWETGFKHYYNGEKTEDGVTYQVIKLVPENPADKNFHTVKVFINKAKDQVGKIVIYGKQGENFTYAVTTLETNIPYDANTFVFSKSAHPGVDVIDNR